MTYVWTAEGWLYVAAVVDLFSRRVVGWSMSAEMTAQLVTDALVMAIWRRGKPDALLHHSDRGSQYTSEQFQRLMTDHGVVCSMSRSGNVVEYRWAEGRYERLPQHAEELVKLRVAVIAVGSPPATIAVKSATSTIPIVFITADDPVKDGFVTSFNRPGGNLTGVTVFTTAAMWNKRLELLHDLTPKAASAAILVNPRDAANPGTTEMTLAASNLGLGLSFLAASTDADLEAAFATAVERHIDALVISDQPFFTARHHRIVALAAHYMLPAIYGWREYVAAGGLMSYGSSLTDAWHQVGRYAGSILNGAKPADLPVMQASRFEFALNLKTARTLGLTVPPTMLALADEVIE